MSDLDDSDIENVLRELEVGVSEGDSIFCDDAGSEEEDNVEVDSEVPSEPDDTFEDPDYSPSDNEPNLVSVREKRPYETDSEDEAPTRPRSGNQPDPSLINLDLEQPSTSTSGIGEVDINSPNINANHTNAVTLMDLDIDSYDENNDLIYKPSSGESSTDDCSDVEIAADEVNNIIALQEESQVCTNSNNDIVNLFSLKNHKNIVLLRTRNPRGKNGHVWSSKYKPRSGRVQRRNVVHYRQKPINNAKNVDNPVDCFKLFITREIIECIVINTNEEIAHKSQSYSKESATVRPTTATEIEALLGLLVLTAALKDNHLTSEELFDASYSGSRYVSAMSKSRFDFLLNCLRFDEKDTRQARRKVDKLAPIREVWELFIQSCRNNYCPGSYVTIDEQLLGFRGRCPFRMYLPSKPNKYGIKILMLCDVKTKYLIDGTPYLGKSSNTSGLPLGTFYTKELTKTIHGTGRNITMDNWFSSIPLAKDMLSTHTLTVVGTLRGDKKEIPPQMKDLSSRKVDSVMFCYDNDLILASYKAKKNKMVYLISTTHEKGTISETTGKPEIVEFYNSTKGAVDTFDEMSSNMSCSRKTRRWPLCIFYGIINSTLVNSYVIYVHNMLSNKKKPVSRREFAKKVSEDLVKQQLLQRVQTPTLQRNVKSKIEEVLGKDTPVAEPQPAPAPAPAVRKICAFCPSSKRRMTRFSCFDCKKHYCGEHQSKKCVNCTK